MRQDEGCRLFTIGDNEPYSIALPYEHVVKLLAQTDRSWLELPVGIAGAKATFSVAAIAAVLEAWN